MGQDRGRPGEPQTPRVGQARGRRSAITAPGPLDGLEGMFARPASAIEGFGAPLGCGRVQRRDDKTRLIPRAHDCRLEHAAPRLGPGLGGIATLVIEAPAGRGRRPRGLRQAHAVLRPTLGCLHEGGGWAAQDGLAGQAKDTSGPAPRRDALQHCWGRAMTVTAAQDGRSRPGATQRRQQAYPEHGLFGPCGAGTWAPRGSHQRLRRACENAPRQGAMVPVVLCIKGERLLALRGIIGVGELKDHSGRRLSRAGAAGVHQGAGETIKVLAVHWRRKTRERGGTRPVLHRLQGPPLQTQCA
jgi:hypothetical protein